ncbi:MAG: cell division protein FtsZ [Patescibacteria group bacterium]
MKKQKKSAAKKDRPQNTPLLNIKVVGIGGGGGNAVSRISKDFIRGVEFLAINTDHQDLDHCEVRHKVYIGRNLTRGLGTGMNPDLGRQAGEENRSEIAEALRGADLIFLAAGLGGGTGSGTTPIVAEVAKQNGALTLAFVTKPFAFEGSQRQKIAEEALLKLKDKVDALVVVPNDRIFTIISKDTPIMKAFEAIDDVLKNSLAGLVDLIVSPGIINVDFADVKTVIQDAGSAIMGLGIASGPDRAVNAVNQALNSPLLEVNPEGARGVLLSVSGGRDLRMNEVNDAARMVAQTVDPAARIIFGAYYDRKLKPNQIKITLIATGFSEGVSGGSLFGASGNFGEAKTSFFGTPRPFHDETKKSEEAKKEEEDLLFVKHKTIPAEAPKEDKTKSKKPESDAWDIPTFLRRKRK